MFSQRPTCAKSSRTSCRHLTRMLQNPFSRTCTGPCEEMSHILLDMRKVSYMAACGFVALHLEITGKLRKSIRPWNSLHKLPQRRAARGTKGLDNVRVPPLSFASYDTDCPRITPEAHWRRRNCALTVLSHAILQVRFVE